MIYKWENRKPAVKKVTRVVILRGKAGCREDRVEEECLKRPNTKRRGFTGDRGMKWVGRARVRKAEQGGQDRVRERTDGGRVP